VALSLWDCKELARQLEADGLVDHISAETVRRVLAADALKPWRYHSWLSAKVPRDAAFAAIERAEDINLSTLARYVAAIGGEANLEVVIAGAHIQLLGSAARAS
jgi:hypothetical protein